MNPMLRKLLAGAGTLGDPFRVAIGGATGDNADNATNPVLAAVKAATANPLPATSGRQQSLLGTALGAAVVKPFSIPEADWQFAGPAAGLTAAVDTVVKAAAAAGLRNYVTALQLANTSATAGQVEIKDGAAVLARLFMPAGSAQAIAFPTPLRGSPATAVAVNPVVGPVAVIGLQGFVAP